MAKLAVKCLLLLIRIYQNALSPLLPARCRFYPTCSEYARLSLLWHGPWRGLLLAMRRVMRCHPLGGQGLDFVPIPLYQDTFVVMHTPPTGLGATQNETTDAIPSFVGQRQSSDGSLKICQALATLATKPSIFNPAPLAPLAPLRLLDRGVFKDTSSYSSRLNHRLKQASCTNHSS